MPSWFNAWLADLSAWPLFLFICIFFIAVTWIGIVVVHPFLRRMIHGEEPSNEVIIHSAGVFGMSYAVLLGLLSIATFDSTRSLVNTVASESSDLSTLYRTADGYPEPLRGELKGLLQDYTRYVIDKDWPAQARPRSAGRRAPAAGVTADVVRLRADDEDTGGITALGLGMLIFLIYAMDRPLQGAVSVFVSVYDSVMKWDDH